MKIPPKVKAWLVDVAERVGSSFGEAIVAAVAAGALAKGVNATTAHVLLVAGLTAAAATLKGILAAAVKGSVSPASLAPRLVRPPPNGHPSHIHRNVVLVHTLPLFPGGGRHVEHDERSRAYAVTPKPMSALVSVRHARHGSVLNQQNLGSCTGNAGTGAMMTDPFPEKKLTEKWARQLYSDATKVDNVPGVWPPTDTGSSGLAVAKVLRARGLITGYLHCFSPQAVYTALQDGPVLVGVNWLEGFDSPTGDGQMVYTGSTRGGHELCMDEIDVVNRRVWVTNSWGRSWGVAGRAWWSFDDFAKVMADQGDVTVPRR